MRESLKEKEVLPDHVSVHGPIPAGTPRIKKSAVRPITSACNSMLTPLINLMLAVDKLFTGELQLMTHDTFSTPCEAWHLEWNEWPET